MKYQIYIKHKDGGGSYLMHRDRMAWSLRTARKHLRDVTAARVSGRLFEDVQYFALVAA